MKKKKKEISLIKPDKRRSFEQTWNPLLGNT